MDIRGLRLDCLAPKGAAIKMSNRFEFRPRWRAITSLFVIVALVIWFYRPRQQDTSDLLRKSTSSDHAGATPFELPDHKPQSDIEVAMGKADPRRDSWQSESISSAIDKQLKLIRDAIEKKSHDSRAPATAWKSFVTEDFVGDLSEASEFQLLHDSSTVQVRRRLLSPVESKHASTLRDVIQSWSTAVASIDRCSFKIVDIDADDPAKTVTQVLVQLTQANEASTQQDDLVVNCEWNASDATPRLARIATQRHDRVVLSAKGGLYDDVTHRVLSETPGYQEQVRLGIDHWSTQLTRLDDMSLYGHHGLALGDVNNDGRDDLYVCDAGGLPNRLYVQQADGTVRDVSEESGCDWLESSTSALLLDLDNDGQQDLVVATVAAIIVAAGDGTGKFQIRAAHPGLREAQTLCASDYDNDGLLDIYVCCYGAEAEGGARGFEATLPIPYNDAQNGGRNVLLRNRGRWNFEDVTESCGLEVNNRRWSFSASWEDFDQDGDPDLYVANDFGRNCLYRNDGGVFAEVAGELGVQDISAGMSVAWGDPNLDGRMDLYVGNMYSAAGNRITFQRKFLNGRDANVSAAVQRMARGNTLFTAQSDGTFRDDSLAAGVTMGRWAWGSKFVDFNNDGQEDLMVMNGYFTNHKTDDL